MRTSFKAARPGRSTTPTVLDRRVPSELDQFARGEIPGNIRLDHAPDHPHIGGRVARFDSAPSLLSLEELHLSATDDIDVPKRLAPRFLRLRRVTENVAKPLVFVRLPGEGVTHDHILPRPTM